MAHHPEAKPEVVAAEPTEPAAAVQMELKPKAHTLSKAMRHWMAHHKQAPAAEPAAEKAFEVQMELKPKPHTLSKAMRHWYAHHGGVTKEEELPAQKVDLESTVSAETLSHESMKKILEHAIAIAKLVTDLASEVESSTPALPEPEPSPAPEVEASPSPEGESESSTSGSSTSGSSTSGSSTSGSSTSGSHGKKKSLKKEHQTETGLEENTEYQTGTFGTIDCPEGTKPIGTEYMCKQATKILQKTWVYEQYEIGPSGCVVDMSSTQDLGDVTTGKGSVYWNQPATPSIKNLAAPLCEKA